MSNQPAAIIAATVRCQTMADDSLRVVLDIEPNDAQQAFKMFGKRGSTVAIARLTDEAAKADMQAKAAGAKGPHGKFAHYLMSHGFFDSPRVRQVLQAPNDLAAPGVKDMFKANISHQLNCRIDSLTEVSPPDVKRWIAAHDVIFTIPEYFFSD